MAVIGAEYVLRMVPRGTHDAKKFIRPAELLNWVDETPLREAHYRPALQSAARRLPPRAGRGRQLHAAYPSRRLTFKTSIKRNRLYAGFYRKFIEIFIQHLSNLCRRCFTGLGCLIFIHYY